MARFRPDGSRWAHERQFLEVRPPSVLTCTWRWVEGPLPPVDALVELTFREDGAGTVLSVRHGPFGNRGECDQHVAGWTDTCARLDVWLRS